MPSSYCIASNNSKDLLYLSIRDSISISDYPKINNRFEYKWLSKRKSILNTAKIRLLEWARSSVWLER